MELLDPARVSALHETGLLDAPPEGAFERITRLVTRSLDVSVSVASLVEGHRQFFTGQIGLDEPWATLRQTPLSHSVCQYVVGDDQPLVVRDARTDPRLASNLAISELGVVAYAGVPLRSPEGLPLGSLCAIADEPRDWSDDDLRVLTDLAAMASSEIALRVAAVRHRSFVSDIAHRLGTPITGVRMHLDEMATRPGVEPDIRSALAEAQRRMADLTAELEQVATSAHGDRFGYELTVDLATFLRDLAARWSESLRREGRTVVFDGDTSADVTVPVAALSQAIDLLVLTLLAHRDGAVRLSLLPRGDVIRIRIEGEGDPLPTEVAARMLRRIDHTDHDDAVPTHPSGSDDLSVAEFVARRLGGRLTLPPTAVPAFDVFVPAGVVGGR